MATQGCATIKDQVSWYKTRMSLPLGSGQQRQGHDGSNGAAHNEQAAPVLSRDGANGGFAWSGIHMAGTADARRQDVL